MNATVVWFRQDLRLADHAPLQAALQRGGMVIPVYVHSPDEAGAWAAGAAANVWLHASLGALDIALHNCASRLIIRSGAAGAVLEQLCREAGADAVYWQRRYEPAAAARDATVIEQLRAAGIIAESYAGALLLAPEEVATQQGTPFMVFTAFWRRALQVLHPPAPHPAPTRLPAPAAWPASQALSDLPLLPSIRWDEQIAAHWAAGASAAHARLRAFADQRLPAYAHARDQLSLEGSTSTLSPYLHIGALSPRQVWHAVGAAEARRGLHAAEWRAGKFLSELLWRDFTHHLLHHFPTLADTPWHAEFEHLPYRHDTRALHAWQRGRTGVPLVDAGMRQLWALGWMPNRMRMIVASFLVKNLLQPWQNGARWFWDTLVDADLANNSFNWQWVAGCGIDAAPFFRIFNPVTQGQKFDANGAYIRRWLPELAALDTPHIHAPWLASPATLARAGVKLGTTYPRPIVDLQAARAAALAAFKTMRAQHFARRP